jgi:N-acetylmuramoyl-L-alanine amidase
MVSISRWLPLVPILLLGGAALWLQQRERRAEPKESGAKAVDNGPHDNVAEPVSPRLSILGKPPDWARLEAWQESMTREDFEALLTGVFVVGERWREFIEIGEDAAVIRTGEGEGVFVLRFGKPGEEKPAPRGWNIPEELAEQEEGKPLKGLHIAIDPGHIGGAWARVEERWLQVAGHPPVQEGDMTLLVAKKIKPRLEGLGARVTLVRDSLEPVTLLRPESLEELAAEQGDPDSPQALRKFAERLFYRTAEIRARADLVNGTIKPDLVLCLHFNADAWGDAANPKLVERTHFHLLLNGGYTDEEVALADQRFILLEKILSRTHAEEVKVGSTVADVFVRKTGLPPFIYPPEAPNAREIPGEPYLWARNLLANRLYECPVIFYEPYVMNSIIDHPRLVAGDYDGLREINGKWLPSIFREYADAVVEGLQEHYASRR